MDQLTPLLQVGAQFTISAAPFEVAHVGQDGLRICPIKGGITKRLSFASIHQLFAQGAVAITYTPPSVHPRSRAGLTEAQCIALNRKLAYVRAVHKGALHPGSQREIEPVIATTAKELNDQDPPGISTVAGWVKKWVNGGCCEAALMPKPKPSRSEKLENEDLVRIVNKAIHDVYLTPQQNSISAVHAEVAISIADYNASAEKPLTVPSTEYVRKLVHRIDKYRRDVARHGKHYANRRHRAAGIATFTTEALELVEADGQMLDVVAVEEGEDGKPGREIGRPYATAFLDVNERCILSVLTTLAPFCGATLLKAFSMATVADGDKPRGVPQKLVIDNGCDYQDSGFLAACNKVGTVVEPCEPKAPNGKPHIERFFRTLSEDLIHKLPGTTFSNPEQRGDYDTQGMARLTMKELTRHIDTWVDQVYQTRLHGGIGRTPNAAWREAIEKTPIRTLSKEEADLMLRTSVERTVVKGRVEVHDLQWKSDALRTWEVSERAQGRSPRVDVRVDELDLSTVYAVTPKPESVTFKLVSCKPEYTEHLSLHEHRVLQKLLFKQGIKDRAIEMEDAELYRLRCEYYASLGHKDDKVAARKRDRLRDAVAKRREAPLVAASEPSAPTPEPSAPAPSTAATDTPEVPAPAKPAKPKRGRKTVPASPEAAPSTPVAPASDAPDDAPPPSPEAASPAKPTRQFRFDRHNLKRTPR